MVGTQLSLQQSTFIGVDIGRPRFGAGSPPQGRAGLPPISGSLGSPLSPFQAGEPPSSPSVGNLSEQSGGYVTEIQGQRVQIAYPFS